MSFWCSKWLQNLNLLRHVLYFWKKQCSLCFYFCLRSVGNAADGIDKNKLAIWQLDCELDDFNWGLCDRWFESEQLSGPHSMSKSLLYIQQPCRSKESHSAEQLDLSLGKFLTCFLFFSRLGTSKDVPKIITKEHFFSKFKSQLITVGGKVIRSSSQRQTHQTSSLQALSGFISLSSPLSQHVMTLSRTDCSPFIDDKSWLWNIEPTNIIWLTISWSLAELLWLTGTTAWIWLNSRNDRVGDRAGEILPSVITASMLGLCPSLLLYVSEGGYSTPTMPEW